MHKRFGLTGLFAIATLALGMQIHAADTPTKTQDQEIDIKKVSETFGNFIGRNLDAPGVTFDMDSIIKGIRDGVEGKPAPLTDQEYMESMATLQRRAFTIEAEKNLKEAEQFLSKNSGEEGVIEIEPGKLQYKILEEGNGETVSNEGHPLLQYSGKYLDGTVFGNSIEAGGPITVPLGQTIPGFNKGIAGMKEGEKRRLFIHPDMGYGTTGQLAPNALLIFDIEVIKAEAPEDEDEADDKTSDASLDENIDDIYFETRGS